MREDVMTVSEMVRLATLVAIAVVAVTVLGFVLFMLWSKKDRRRRSAQIEIGRMEEELRRRKQ